MYFSSIVFGIEFESDLRIISRSWKNSRRSTHYGTKKLTKRERLKSVPRLGLEKGLKRVFYIHNCQKQVGNGISRRHI